MKVIKEPDAFKPQKVQCRCTAVLEIEFADIKRYYYPSQFGNDTTDYAFVECPCCNHQIILAKNLLPEWLYAKLPTER